MANQVAPWKIALEHWREQVVNDTNYSEEFRSRWMRLCRVQMADLGLVPFERHHKSHKCVGLHIEQLGERVGSFICCVKDHADEKRSLIISAPTFSDDLPEELKQATLESLFRLAPEQTLLEVVLEDDISATLSTLAVAGKYTEAGWGLNPAHTSLVSDDPRTWIFRFTKNS